MFSASEGVRKSGVASERSGIPTRFPHNSALYELLTNKTWVHMLCSSTEYRIPASVSVPKFLEKEVFILETKPLSNSISKRILK